MNTLLEQLITEQTTRQMSDYQFVKFLNFHSNAHVSRQLWHQTRNKHIPLGFKILKATVQTFPELEAAVIDYLKKNTNHE